MAWQNRNGKHQQNLKNWRKKIILQFNPTMVLLMAKWKRSWSNQVIWAVKYIHCRSLIKFSTWRKEVSKKLKKREEKKRRIKCSCRMKEYQFVQFFYFFFLLLCPSSGNSAIVGFQRLKHGKIRTLAQKDPFFHFQGFAFKNNSLAKIPQKSLYCCMYISSRSPQCPDILLGIKETHFL